MMLYSLAKNNRALLKILSEANEKYDDALAENLILVDPKLSVERRRHIAQLVRMLLDGFAVQSIHESISSPRMIALKGELKAVLTKFFD
jgi:hypothetical protein